MIALLASAGGCAGNQCEITQSSTPRGTVPNVAVPNIPTPTLTRPRFSFSRGTTDTTGGGEHASRPAFHAPAFHAPQWDPGDPFGDFFSGFADGMAAAVTGVAGAFVAAFAGFAMAFLAFSMSIALLPLFLATALLGALLTGLFGWVGVFMACVFTAIALALGQLMFLWVAVLFVFLYALAGAAGIAVGGIALTALLLRRVMALPTPTG